MTNIFDRYADPELLSRVFLEMYISAAKYRKSIQPQYIKIPIIIETNMHFWFFCYFKHETPIFHKRRTSKSVLDTLQSLQSKLQQCDSLENFMESFAFSCQTQ